MVQVHSEPFLRRYYAPLFSQAFLFNFVLFFGSIALSICVAYSTGGFWNKYNTNFEQPSATFSWNAALLLQGATVGQERVWTTSQAVNEGLLDKLAAGSMQVSQLDTNFDSKVESFLVKIVTRGSPPVYGAKLLLEFVYRTHSTVKIHMTGLGYIEHSASTPGSRLSVNGELRLQQSHPLLDKSTRTVYNASLLNLTAFGADSAVPVEDLFQFDRILSVYNRRNETTYLSRPAAVWLPSAGGDEFSIVARIQVPSHEVVVYRAMRLELLKFGWVQFLAIYAIFWWLARWCKWFVHKYQVCDSRIRSDLQPRTHTF
jgi:hypothetical protein